ncbi:MAG: PKD domain-containing protein [Alphaproteobacteria bacterium]|nr:PKD domain-containing protein [Alphaproteobacteria bacterium]
MTTRAVAALGLAVGGALVGGCGEPEPGCCDTCNCLVDTVDTSGETATGRPEVEAGADVVVAVGTPVTLGATAEGATDALWDLGDGTRAEGLEVTHTYDAPGNHVATVQVTAASGLKATDSLRVTAYLPAAAPLPAASSTLAIDAVRGVAWVPVPEADAVAAIDLATRSRTMVPVCDGPRSVAVDGSRGLVACEEDDTLVVLDLETRAVSGVPVALPPGSHPRSVVLRGDTAWIAGRGGAVWQTQGDAAPAILFEGPDPGALAVDGTARVFAARRRSTNAGAEVLGSAGAIALGRDPGPDSDTTNRGVPTNLHALAISPDGGTLYVGATLANVDRGLFVERDTTPRPGTFETTLRSTLRVIDLVGGVERFKDRKQIDNHGQVNALALSPRGNWLYAADQGTGTVFRFDAYTLRAAGAIVDAGQGIAGLALVDDGDTLLVDAWLERELRAYDVSDPSATQPPLRWSVATVDAEPIADPVVLQGKRIFHDAGDVRMTKDGYLTCSACHPDGADDGMTWDFTHRGEGLRNTTSLEGRAGTGMGPVHWTGNFDEIQDFEHDIRNQQGGLGFLPTDDYAAESPLGPFKSGRSPELDALAAYVTSLDRTPGSPHAAPAGGAQAFATAGCATCHPAPLYTDSVPTNTPAGLIRHDVGTTTLPGAGTRLGEPLDGFDTPTLLGSWATGPYLHDGSAPSIEDAIRAHDGGTFDATGLTPQDLTLIADFVRSL